MEMMMLRVSSPFPLAILHSSNLPKSIYCFPYENLLSKRRKAIGPAKVLARPSGDGNLHSDDHLHEDLTLDGIENCIVRQEHDIVSGIFGSRSHHCRVKAYEPRTFSWWGGSSAEHEVKVMECIFALGGLFERPDENPFFPEGLAEPMEGLPTFQYPQVLHHSANKININEKVWDMYFGYLLPHLVNEGARADDDGLLFCEMASGLDALCLHALSKRIHYGKFEAEAKFRANPKAYEVAIRSQDESVVMDVLTNLDMEESGKRRIEEIVRGSKEIDNINPELVAHLYGESILPLNKQVQLKYLLKRLD